MLNASYKMAASSKDKRTPITTPPYKVPCVDVTPDPPTVLSLILSLTFMYCKKKATNKSFTFWSDIVRGNLPTFGLAYAHCIKILQLRCNSVGQPQGTSYAGCVSGTKVANYGAPYDFNSIMHYGVFS